MPTQFFMDKVIGTIARMFEDNQEVLSLEWVTGESVSAGRPMAIVEQAASPDLVGYLNLIHPNRIQVFGTLETRYFNRLEDRRRQQILTDLANSNPPAVVAAEGLEPAADLVEMCRKHDIPLLSSSEEAAQVIEVLRSYLARHTAQVTILHGVLMDVLGVGVLITGESGLGKSELALELISRGHGLVADDVVELSRISPSNLEGRCPRLLANLLEVRGLGLLDIRAIFGETAVRRKMRLKLIVHLVRGTTMENEYERLPLDTLTQDVLGLRIRKVVVPVAAGRNIAVLLEAAVRNTILQLRGIDTMREFMERQSAAMNDDLDVDL